MSKRSEPQCKFKHLLSTQQKLGKRNHLPFVNNKTNRCRTTVFYPFPPISSGQASKAPFPSTSPQRLFQKHLLAPEQKEKVPRLSRGQVGPSLTPNLLVRRLVTNWEFPLSERDQNVGCALPGRINNRQRERREGESRHLTHGPSSQWKSKFPRRHGLLFPPVLSS